MDSSYLYEGIVENIIDGDTIDITVDLGFGIRHFVRFRLDGIDAYETRLIGETTEEQKEKGIEGKELLKDLLVGENVLIETFKRGKYGRYLARIYIDTDIESDSYVEVYDEEKELLDVNEMMVEKGYAVRYSDKK